MFHSRRDSGHRAREYSLLGLAFGWIPATLKRLSTPRENYTPDQLAYFAQDAIAYNAYAALDTTFEPADRADLLFALAHAVRRMSELIGSFSDSDADDLMSHAIESRIVENTALTQRAIAEGLDADDLPLTAVIPGAHPDDAAAELRVWILLAGEHNRNTRADYLEQIADLVFDLAGGEAGPQAAETAHCLANAERAAA